MANIKVVLLWHLALGPIGRNISSLPKSIHAMIAKGSLHPCIDLGLIWSESSEKLLELR